MSKPSIPDIPKGGAPDRRAFDAAVKETLDMLTGRRRGSAPIEPLPDDATPDDVKLKLNEVIARMNP